MASQSMTTSGERRFLSVHDLAEMFGCHVSTIWRHVGNGTLPRPIRLGGMTRWPIDEVHAAIERAKEARESA